MPAPLIPILAGAGLGLGALFGANKNKAPRWRDVSLNTNLGFSTDARDYDIGSSGLLARGNQFADMDSEYYTRMSGIIDDAVAERQRYGERLLSSTQPGFSTLTRVARASGASGGLSNVIAGQQRSAGLTDAMDKASMLVQDDALQERLGIYTRGQELALSYLGLGTQARQYEVGERNQAIQANKRFAAETLNTQTMFNAQGRYGADLAGWQDQQARWGQLATAGFGLMGMGVSSYLNPRPRAPWEVNN